MLIEELIRLGQPLVEGGFEADELICLITDVASANARNFYQHVFVVELPSPEDGPEVVPVVLPLQVWGNPLNNDFDVDHRRALGAPILLPVGGNPLQPQGRYGVSVYPCWNRHFQDFRTSAEATFAFLQGRTQRTPNFTIREEELQAGAERLHQEVANLPVGPRDRWLGVLVLARPGEGSIYRYVPMESGQRLDHLGESVLRPGHFIVADQGMLLERLWEARVAEGAARGRRNGACSFSGENTELITPYCTVWPWAFLAWTCPLPHAGDANLLVEGIGLSPATYRALTAGACVFKRLQQLIHPIVVHELFSPVGDQEGRELAQHRSLTDLPRIYGSAFALPVEDRLLTDEEERQGFTEGVRMMLGEQHSDGGLADRYLSAVTGFDVLLPESFDMEDYRLTLVYYSGDPTRGDIHLRAFIQDVLPSTTGRLREMARDTGGQAVRLVQLMAPRASEKLQARVRNRCSSVPYLLSRGYGGSHLWTQLERVLHRAPLDTERLTANSAARLRSLVPRFPDTLWQIQDEVVFYLACHDFVTTYQRDLAIGPGEEPMAMRPWSELLNMIERQPVTEIHYDNVAELGFGCGTLIRIFSRRYWIATRVGREGKDFLKHRVLTFGADLTPNAVFKQGLKGMFEVAAKITSIRFGRDLQERVGATITEYDRLQEQVRNERDSFTTAFWAGYALQGYDRPRKPSKETNQSPTQTTGAQA
jgi:hypothetical protein